MKIIKPGLTGKTLVPVLLIILLCFISGELFSGSYRSSPLLEEIKKLIQEKALRPPSQTSLKKLRINKLSKGLKELDPYARYIPPATSKGVKPSEKRIGVRLFSFQSKIYLTPEPGGPASTYKLPEVAELTAINGKRIKRNLTQTTRQLDQAIKSGVVCITLRENFRKKEFTIYPGPYQLPTLSSKTVNGFVVIRVVDFVSHRTAPAFLGLYQAIVQTDSQIILDLRGCPGGDLYEAMEIAGMFIPEGKLLLTTYNRDGKLHSYRSPEGRKFKPPRYLLLDYQTASAAEIFAGILARYGDSELVGTQSYGKCDSQTVFNMSNGGELWLTTLSTFFNDNTSCSPMGVKPDITIPDISITRLSEIVKKLAAEYPKTSRI